jgi:hypothetical protein
MVLVLALVAAGTAATASSTARPTLKVGRSAPLTLVGTHFVAREQVRVTVVSDGRRARKTLAANERGRFVVRFSTVVPDRCNGLLVSAIGSRGSRAGLKLPQPMCPPRL